MNTIILDGSKLTVDQLSLLSTDNASKVDIDKKLWKLVERSNKFLNEQLDKRIIYGVNTGLGPMASHIIGQQQIFKLQENLIRSHAVGMGEPIDEKLVLAAMVVRLNTLIKGYSGVTPALLKQLQLFINSRIVPIVPKHGAVGTSGDLVQLAHIALALMGEGQVMFQGKIQPSSSVLSRLKIKPIKLQPKEGLALINGTAAMAGITSLVCKDASRLIELSLICGALAMEVVGAFSDSLSEKLHALRPHLGQQLVARQLRQILKTSHRLKNRSSLDDRIEGEGDVTEISQTVQDVYSFRCIAQILGPIVETYQKTLSVVETEINSVTDNPIVDWDKKYFLHGGNFHGEYVAAFVDQLKAGLVKLTMLSERRINFFLNKNVNKTLPAFLNLKTPGLSLALQGLQFVATSTTATSQSMAFPHHIHSITTNSDNQDVVSMGTDAALIAREVVANAYIVLTIELITLTQAVDVLQIDNKLCSSSKTMYKKVRRIFPKITEDRVITDQLQKLTQELLDTQILNVKWHD